MYTDRETRAKLEALSLKVYGRKNAYNKIFNKGLKYREYGAVEQKAHRPKITTTTQWLTLQELFDFLTLEAQKIDEAAIRKI